MVKTKKTKRIVQAKLLNLIQGLSRATLLINDEEQEQKKLP